MRNILVKVSHRDKARLAEKLKQIWLQPDRGSAERLAQLIIEEYEGKYPEARRFVEEGLEDSLQFYNFPEIDKRRILSTNVLERTNREIRQRSRAVEFFLRLSLTFARLFAISSNIWKTGPVIMPKSKLKSWVPY
jgi:transposase-like protein